MNQLGVGVMASQRIRRSKVNELLKLWAKETPLTHFVDTGSGWFGFFVSSDQFFFLDVLFGYVDMWGWFCSGYVLGIYLVLWGYDMV